MENKDDVKDFYKTKCVTPDDNDADSLAVTSCTRQPVAPPPHVKQALALVHPDVIKRSYGCSTSYPEALEGCKILDLGSGTGRDCFVLSSLVGQDGQVIGMDMLDEMLDFAKGKVEYHQEKYGYASPNVSFVKGYMENMEEAGLKKDYFDVIVSNCVISLCKDKKRVLREAAKVLKPYGEMYFSDVYRQGEPPQDVMDDSQFWCEGLTGSMTYQQLNEIAEEVGFAPPRVVRATPLPVKDKMARERLGDVKYAAVTYRLFKKTPEPALPVSNYIYKGGMRGYEDSFQLDCKHTFKKNIEVSLDEETATVVGRSRYSKYFERTGDAANAGIVFERVDPFKLL